MCASACKLPDNRHGITLPGTIAMPGPLALLLLRR